MKKRLLITTCILALPLSISLLQAASHHGPGRGMMLQHLDSDGDGQITREEFDTGHAAHFGKLDLDSSGSFTIEEMDQMREAMREKRRQKRFQRWDQDGDGNVTQEEFNAHGSDMFSGMDTDENGVVDQSEIKGWHPMKKGHHQPN